MIGSTRKSSSYVPAALVALSMVLVPAASQAQPATDVELELVLSGMDTTVDLQGTHVAGDDRLFAVGRHGVIEIINFDGPGNATLDPTPFLDIMHVSVANLISQIDSGLNASAAISVAGQ